MKELTENVIGAAMEVSTILGPGFLEKVYERALLRELKLRGLKANPQQTFSVMYKGQSVGDYQPDILVEDALLIELKCAESLAGEHTAQCLNYLKGTGLKLCLLFNFQKPRLEWKRIALGL